VTAKINTFLAERQMLQYRTFGYGHSFGILSHYYGREAALELREDIDTGAGTRHGDQHGTDADHPRWPMPGAGGYREHDILVITEDGAEDITHYPYGPAFNVVIVVVGADGKVASHFSAGTVDITGIDTGKDGRLDFTGGMAGVAREPDGIAWIDADHFVTANEGDWKGGARGFTIWKKDGTVVYDSGPSLELAIAAIGHYPDKRSKKGAEPESLEIADFDGQRLLFVAAERSSIIGVYDLTDIAAPRLLQLLPSGISPEGLVAIPARNLLATANEVDLREDGLAPAHVMIYRRDEGTAAYPTLTSAGSDPLIGWGALSGLAADPETAGRLYAVSDSFYSGAPTIYTIDTTVTPARIVAATVVKRGGDVAQLLDLEGIAPDGEGGFWLASEGRSDRLVPHAIYHTDAEGRIDREIALPAELLDNETRFGFEGIAVNGNHLWMAVQREWQDDPRGMTKLLAYDLTDKSWGAVHYPLDAAPDGGWMGLSEIAIHGDKAYVIERDNQIAGLAAVKKIYSLPVAQLVPTELGSVLPVVTKTELRDLIPDLKRWNGYVVDKVEGFAIDSAGTGWLVTDNDGIDDSSGETFFWSIGGVQ
jgi:hypothetical protein